MSAGLCQSSYDHIHPLCLRATGRETAVLQAENLLLDYFGLQSPGWQRDVTVANIKFGPGYKDYENVLQVGPVAPPCTCCVCVREGLSSCINDCCTSARLPT